MDAHEAGMDETSLAALSVDLAGDGDQAVLRVNAELVTVFLTIASQWRTAIMPNGFGFAVRWIGLDYTAAIAALNALEIRVTRDLFRKLQVMEAAALPVLNGDAG